MHFALFDLPCCIILNVDYIIFPFIGLTAILCGCCRRIPANQWRTGDCGRNYCCKWTVEL